MAPLLLAPWLALPLTDKYRPPYSASNAQVDSILGDLGYHVTYFNLDTEGYLHDDPNTIQQSKDIWDGAVEGANTATT